MKNFRRKISITGLLFLGILSVSLSVLALGPIGGRGTQATIYTANRFPMSYQTDRGSLGTFNNQQPTAIADFSFGEWENLTTAILSFTNAGQLDHDVTSATDPLISGLAQFTDGIFPVIFDNNGAITDARIGAGASNQVYGFASSFSGDGISYEEGLVVINGKLTAQANVEPIYREVITHEIGHMLGIGHSQISLGADFSLMYPTTLTDVNNIGIDPDDAASMSLLYPAPGYPASVGSISGIVQDADGNPLSGVNVLAVNVATGDVYSTVSDYYGGDDPLFVNKPPRTGAYTLQGLPPGNYYVRIEPINPLFQSGSRVASYLTPINTDIWREWYNGPGENGSMLVDNSHEKTAVIVTAGNTTSGIDFSANDSPTITEMTAFNGTIGQVIELPLQVSSITFGRFATRYTAPTNGSLVGVRIFAGEESLMPADGALKVTVYRNTQGSLAGIPGDTLGSVTIPFSEIVAGHENDFWLRGIGQPINFVQGVEFHVGVEVINNGQVVFFFDNAVGTQNQTSYYVNEARQWRNLPDGLTGGAAGWNIRMRALYSTVPAGVPTPLLSLTPDRLNFGSRRIGEKATEELVLRNVGTADLTISNLLIAGSGADKFTIESGGGSFTLQPGQSGTLVIGFTPEDQSLASAILNVIHNAAGSPTAVNLSGLGKSAVISSVPDVLEFGGQPVNQSGQKEFSIFRNTGNDTLRIADVEIIGPDSAAFSVRTFSPLLWVGLLQTFRATLTFKPTEERAYNAAFRVEHNLPSSPLIIPITGTGTADIGSVTEIRSGDFRVSLLGARPNPVGGEGEIFWEIDGSGRLPVELLLVDAAGRTVFREDRVIIGSGAKTFVSVPVDFSAFSPGIYQIVLRSKRGTAVERVVVVR